MDDCLYRAPRYPADTRHVSGRAAEPLIGHSCSPPTKESLVKRCLPAVALAALAFPAAAPAVPAGPIVNPDLRGPQQPVYPYVAQHLPALGTDVAAPDQQAPIGG